MNGDAGILKLRFARWNHHCQRQNNLPALTQHSKGTPGLVFTAILLNSRNTVAKLYDDN